MGSFYATVTVTGITQQQLANELKSVRSFISPSMDGLTVFYPAIDYVGTDEFSKLLGRLSLDVKGKVFMASVWDDAAFYYQLWVNNELVDQYISNPAAFSGEDGLEVQKPIGGNPSKLSVVYACNDEPGLSRILSASLGESKFILESNRHSELASILRLPESSVGIGYEYIERGELPAGIQFQDLIKTG